MPRSLEEREQSVTTLSRPKKPATMTVSTRVTRNLMKERSQSEKQERRRIRSVIKRQCANEGQVTPRYQTHEQLWQIFRKLPTDFEPYGLIKRETICDCSAGRRWFQELAGRRGQERGVCTNPRSPRTGLLTFEHQGCQEFELDPRSDFLGTPKGRDARRVFEEREDELQRSRPSHSIQIVEWPPS
jgi:hypothetical protein